MTDLTPTQDLLMNLLVARHRLGERLWTFDARHKTALEQLADRGLATVMHGAVENTVRASLTEAGRAEWVSETYVPPLLAQVEAAAAARAADAYDTGFLRGEVVGFNVASDVAHEKYGVHIGRKAYGRARAKRAVLLDNYRNPHKP